MPFRKKSFLTGKFSKMFSERIDADIEPRLVCKFREIWLTGNWQIRALFTGQKTKLPFALPLSLLRESRPKSARASFRQYTRSAPKFHHNPYTSGRVVAGRVNIVETRHKVFPILGEASSPSKKAVYALDICPSLSYIVNKAICAPAAIKSHVLLSSVISCICLAYIIVRLQHVRQRTALRGALRCVASQRLIRCERGLRISFQQGCQTINF